MDFIQGNAENLNFPDNEFDLVFSNSVLEHVKNPKKALQEMYRVIKPGGKLLVIGYQSLEDRIVKQFLKTEATDCICPTIQIDRRSNYQSDPRRC